MTSINKSRYHYCIEYNWWLGVLLVIVLAMAGQYLSETVWMKSLGFSALTLAIVLGIIIGNTFFPKIAEHTATGVDFSKNTLLRAGIILYGFRITFQQIYQIGMAGLVIDLLIVSLTFLLAVNVGIRLFKLDKQTAMLIGAGSSICGAAAVMAAEPVIKGQAHKVSVAVATVVVFGTLSMFLYPILYPYLNLTAEHYGIFAGSTIHEVAQVVAAGKAVSDTAANTAVIEKMLRVMMLAPFLLVLSFSLNKQQGNEQQSHQLTIPWFAVLFIGAALINSLNIIPAAIQSVLISLDTLLLTMAMAALGLRTHLGAIKQAGIKPLLLALVLFLFLTVGGYIINYIVMYLLG